MLLLLRIGRSGRRGRYGHCRRPSTAHVTLSPEKKGSSPFGLVAFSKELPEALPLWRLGQLQRTPLGSMAPLCAVCDPQVENCRSKLTALDP